MPLIKCCKFVTFVTLTSHLRHITVIKVNTSPAQVFSLIVPDWISSQFTCHSRKGTCVANNITVVPFHLSVPVSYNSAQTCTTAAIITVIIYTCAFPAMTCQNVYCEKGVIIMIPFL